MLPEFVLMPVRQSDEDVDPLPLWNPVASMSQTPDVKIIDVMFFGVALVANVIVTSPDEISSPTKPAAGCVVPVVPGICPTAAVA
jgi:hypothetical protein